MTFYEQLFISISKVFLGYDYYNVFRGNLYNLLCALNPSFVDVYPYGLLNVICIITWLAFIYLFIRVIQQLIGIISKIIGGLF